MTPSLDSLAHHAERASDEDARACSRAELEQRLASPEPVRGTIHEADGVRALVHAVARLRGTARIELADAGVVVELHLIEAELVDATCTTIEGELLRGPRALEHALRIEAGTFEVREASATMRRTLVDPLDVLIGPAVVEARIAPMLDPHDGAVQAIALPAPSHAPPGRASADDATRTSDPRAFARLVDVVLMAAFLGVGMIASILGLADATPEALGDALAGENRAAAELPELTWSNVLEGRYTGAVEAYLADRIPGRAALLEGEGALRRARGLAPDDEDLVLYAVSAEALDLGADAEADLDIDDGLPTDFGAPPRMDEPAEDEDATGAMLDVAPEVVPAIDGATDPAAPTITPRAPRPRRVATRVTSGILIRDGRAMQGFGGDPGGAPEYARTLNAIHEAVHGRATVYAAIVPTAQEFYLPQGARSRGRPERPNIVATYARLVPGIRRVDVHAELSAHTDENIYFRTDHHWTGLGAYYGYRAFCRAAGLEPVALEQMDRRVIHRSWLGSLHRLTRDPTLRPDRVEIAVPRVEASARVEEHDGEEHAVPLFDERYHGYGVFLSGDHPIMRVRTSTQNGRRVILVKNSYGNAFAVYLVSHYENVVIVDYRYFRGRLTDVVEESDSATDLVFMNGALTANSRAHTGFIRRLLDGRR